MSISGLLISRHALALMVMRALGRHPLSGLVVDLGRYGFPEWRSIPFSSTSSFLAASGELKNLPCRALLSSVYWRVLRPPADTPAPAPAAPTECGRASC